VPLHLWGHQQSFDAINRLSIKQMRNLWGREKDAIASSDIKATFVKQPAERNNIRVHMIHSYGVNGCVIARKDAGQTWINS